MVRRSLDDVQTRLSRIEAADSAAALEGHQRLALEWVSRDHQRSGGLAKNKSQTTKATSSKLNAMTKRCFIAHCSRKYAFTD